MVLMAFLYWILIMPKKDYITYLDKDGNECHVYGDIFKGIPIPKGASNITFTAGELYNLNGTLV